MQMHFKAEPVLSANRAELLRLRWLAETYKQRVGARIKQAREAKHWTQPQLSRAMPEKVTPAYISRWETGMAMPGSYYLELLAAALDVDVSFFLVEEPQPGTADLMGALSNGDSPASPAEEIVSLLRQQNELLANVAEALGDLMKLALEQAEQRQPTKKSSGRRKAAGP